MGKQLFTKKMPGVIQPRQEPPASPRHASLSPTLPPSAPHHSKPSPITPYPRRRCQWVFLAVAAAETEAWSEPPSKSQSLQETAHEPFKFDSKLSIPPPSDLWGEPGAAPRAGSHRNLPSLSFFITHLDCGSETARNPNLNLSPSWSWSWMGSTGQTSPHMGWDRVARREDKNNLSPRKRRRQERCSGRGDTQPGPPETHSEGPRGARSRAPAAQGRQEDRAHTPSVHGTQPHDTTSFHGKCNGLSSPTEEPELSSHSRSSDHISTSPAPGQQDRELGSP